MHWNFGDGPEAVTSYLSVGQDFGQTGQGPHGSGSPLFTHSFVPGTYHIVASGADILGNPVAWTITVRVFPRLRVPATVTSRVARGQSSRACDGVAP